jgi:hypothetical protein
MTYFITYLTNDVAQLIVRETRTTDEGVVGIVLLRGEQLGYKVVMRTEG